MAEYGSMFAISGIAVHLFLGGWHLGFLPTGTDMTDVLGFVLGNVINVLVFIFKGWVLVFVMMWVRWTLPRLRIDQVMMTCLRYLLPISCVLLLGVSVWQLAAAEFLWLSYVNWLLAFGSLVLFVMMLVKAMTAIGTTPTDLMPGAWPGARTARPEVAERIS
jgi:NADH-quinone oxidoreductase subunit H